ncbi:hypothetical protein [Deinococcus hopiensis]|uniref:Uncharacterized protein n=1 Tax=Deinococcus hopiensis KR-140 TaxID=695939 RepID=A0A1W1VNQ5_9DEIO|nr:hypothetical protein [Deinococcus hopiensis]SMB95015.1 hypothetical protein SAMN00790413_02654 [Deinococcus hopiensis KR-140]
MNVKISNVLYILGFASIVLSAGNFVAGKTEDGQAQESQERNGLFVGFWPPTFFILGKIVEDREKAGKNLLNG